MSVRRRWTPTVVWAMLAAGLPFVVALESLGAQDRWTPELSMRYRAIEGTALSPDGDLVAYVVRTPVMEEERSEYVSQVWVAATDGSRRVQYTRGEHSARNPVFSPDGQWLAFTTDRSGKNQIWIMRVTGGEAIQLTDAPAAVGAFRWSPDGTRIAYAMPDPETDEEARRKKEKTDVVVVDRDFKYNHLYVVSVGLTPDAGETTQITEGAFHLTAFDWSPDGQTFAFTFQDDPRINTGRLSGDLAMVSAGGGAITPLVTTAGVEGQPRYSPDGRWIAYVSTGDQPEAVGLGDVYVIPAEGGRPRRLADTPDRSATVIGWAGDGSAVLVSEAVRTSRHILSVPVDGASIEVLTPMDGVFGGISFDRDGRRMAFTYQDTNTPPDVYASPTDELRLSQVSDVHAGVPRPPMGRTEVLEWTSGDGTPVEGLLTYPIGYVSGQRYPLVLNVHGGPAGVFSETFTGAPGIYMIQTFAQEGFAVLRPNPRGSTGYGNAFRYANVRDWGYGDYEDLMAGVDHVVQMGVAAPDSLVLTGWSYGGYMTSFAVTRTDRFKAASMGAGLPNLVSMVTTTDIGDYLVAHMGAEFWEDYETYEKHSAIYRIENVTTPTQVIHGAQDLRVPFTQGQEFYTALIRMGVPTEMIVYPRTPHGPREPKFLMDVTPRILQWFNRHLRPTSATTDR